MAKPFLRRGKPDYMSEEQLASFTDELAKYAQHTAAMGGTLWDFGVYGKRDSMEKKAPVIEDLLGNMQLWGICIKYIPNAKPRDCYVTSALK